MMNINIEVIPTDNKLRTGIDAEISILKLTGFVRAKMYVFDRLEVIRWAACKLAEIGVVDPIAAEQVVRKQEDDFVTLHMKEYARKRKHRLEMRLYNHDIKNTYVKSRFNFYKDRLPEDVAKAQAKYEFCRLVVRLRKEKISYRVIGERFGVKADRVRQAFFNSAWRRRDPIESYFEYKDFLDL